MENLDFYKGRNILILGGNGYIGSKLALALSQIECQLVLLLKNSNEALMFPGLAKAQIVLGDVTDKNIWKNILSGIDVVFFLAGHESRDFEPEADFKVNALSILQCLEICKQEKFSPKIIFASSSNLAGLADHMPVNESFRDQPLSLFAIHKLAGEKYLEWYSKEFGLSGATLRLANVYGPSINKDLTLRSALNKMCLFALSSNKLSLFRNAEKVRDYLYIDDAVNAFLSAGAINRELLTGQYFVVGSGEKTAILRAAQLIAEEVKNVINRDVELAEDNEKKLDLVEERNFLADSTLFKKISQWKPKVSLQRGIQETINFLNNQNL